MPTLQQVADLYGPDQLLVLAVNFKERPERALQTGLTLLLLLDVDGQAARHWGVKVFPTTLGIGKQGKAGVAGQGEVDWTAKPPKS